MTAQDWPDRWTALAVIVLVALPAWLLVVGAPQRVWVSAAAELLDGNSLYELAPTASNPHSTRYVYLPIYGMVTAAGLAPVAALSNLAGLSDAAKETLYHLVASLWGAVGWAAVVYSAVAYVRVAALPRRRQWLVALAVGAFPLVVARGTYAGSDLVVAALLLATAVAWRRGRWVDVGLFASLATFKFTALPALAAVGLLAILERRRRETGLAVLGAAAGQLPNLLYFAKFPGDLAMIVANRGALSTYAYQITEYHTYLLPIDALNLTAWYVDVGLPLVVLAFTLAAVVVARRTSVLPALVVAMFPMAYLLPAERRYLPVIVGLLVLLVVRWERRWARLAAVAMVAVSAYRYVLVYTLPRKGAPVFDLETQLIQIEPLVHGAVLLALVVPMAIDRPRLSWQVNL